METRAVVLEEPGRLDVRRLRLSEPGPGDVVVETAWTGVSTGTERLFWEGRMPWFPGHGYPLVPGYEGVGRVVWAGPTSHREEGDWLFVPGARCYGEVRGLFGAAAATVVVEGSRTHRVDGSLGERGVLLALAATAYHAAWGSGGAAPELIVGHGALGRLLARLTVALGSAPPTVWERSAARRGGADGYRVTEADADERTDYAAVYDASGDPGLLDALIGRLARGGEVVLAGFYTEPIRFDFVPAFLREARLRVAAEWTPEDLEAVADLATSGRLSLDGIITDRVSAAGAVAGYRRAFEDADCVKLLIDWRGEA
jgi:3-hydroxyethyl bacteriochlorophyllide a dehydrogenase